MSSTGLGIKKRTIKPIETDMIRGNNFAPLGVDVDSTDESFEDAWIGLWVELGLGRGLKRKGLVLERG